MHVLEQGLPRSQQQKERLEEVIDDVFERSAVRVEELAKGAS